MFHILHILKLKAVFSKKRKDFPKKFYLISGIILLVAALLNIVIIKNVSLFAIVFNSLKFNVANMFL